MRTLIRWTARLYPATWRNRYAAEFDALLDDISPSLGDLSDVLADVLRVRMTTSMDACLEAAPVSAMTLRLPVVVSLSAHGLMIILVLFAVWGHVTTMPLHFVAPLPPRTPEPPPQVTDARVFPNAWTLYSSLPLKIPPQGGTLPLYVADGVGINFLSLPGECRMASLARASFRKFHRPPCAAGVSWRNKCTRRGVCIRGIPDYAGRICESFANLRTATFRWRRSIGDRTLGISAARV
jgi:hypothetical protein